MKKVLFITPHDFFDIHGNGGVKVTRRNYDLLKMNFNEESVKLGLFRTKKHALCTKDALQFRLPENKMEILLSAIAGCRKYLPWDERKIVKILQAEKVDLLFMDSSTLGKLLRKPIADKTIVFFHNVEADYSFQKVKNEGLHYLPSLLATIINEKYAIKKADAIGCLNKRDAERIETLYGRKVDFYLPVTFEDTFDSKKASDDFQKEILFLGSSFAPNRISVEWFIENVMPKLSGIVLNIVGKGFEDKKEEYEKCHNVKVIGTVENTAEYYYRHAIVVMPIRYGSGMKVKTAEAMMYGRIILASDEALEGYETEGVKGIYRCNTAEEYAARINMIFANGVQDSYQPEVRKLFLEKYETGQVEKNFAKMITDLYEQG